MVYFRYPFPVMQAPHPRVEILGCELDRVDLAGALKRCEESISSRRHVQHMAINAAKLVAMQRDLALAGVVGACELVTADGQAIVWASRLLGDPLPERVAGIDLMQALMQRAAAKGYRVFVLGARQEVLEEAVRRLRARYRGLILAGYRNGYFTAEEERDVVEEIRRARADILFVAMGSPAKELFLGRHGTSLEVPFAMGVGGSIDVMAGLTKRAPRLLQRLGLEWLFRLLQEPRRLFGRYAVTNARFVALVGRELLRRRGDAVAQAP